MAILMNTITEMLGMTMIMMMTVAKIDMLMMMIAMLAKKMMMTTVMMLGAVSQKQGFVLVDPPLSAMISIWMTPSPPRQPSSSFA